MAENVTLRQSRTEIKHINPAPIQSKQTRKAGKPINQKALAKRARSKFITNSYVKHLANIEDSECRAGYLNTLECTNTIFVHNGLASGHYCKNRWCLVCARIRTAVLINAYMPELKKLQRPQHLVLTNTNCRRELLPDMCNEYATKWRRIYKAAHKAGLPIVGMKKFECTYNPTYDTYHPHFHFIINGEGATNFVLQKWLQSWKTALHVADRKANKYFAISDESGFRELFKYFTKVITKVPGAGADFEQAIFIEPLNVIMQAMKGRRIFEPLGIKKQIDEDAAFDELAAVDVSEWVTGRQLYQWFESDWLNGWQMGLSNYKPSDELQQLTEKIIL